MHIFVADKLFYIENRVAELLLCRSKGLHLLNRPPDRFDSLQIGELNRLLQHSFFVKSHVAVGGGPFDISRPSLAFQGCGVFLGTLLHIVEGFTVLVVLAAFYAPPTPLNSHLGSPNMKIHFYLYSRIFMFKDKWEEYYSQ